jgi:hypothetical protein
MSVCNMPVCVCWHGGATPIHKCTALHSDHSHLLSHTPAHRLFMLYFLLKTSSAGSIVHALPALRLCLSPGPSTYDSFFFECLPPFQSYHECGPCKGWAGFQPRRCKKYSINSMQTGIMPCATLRTVFIPVYSSSRSFESV